MTVEYRPGKQNVTVDALSSCDEEPVTPLAVSAPTFTIFDELRAELAQHPWALQLRTPLANGTDQPGWAEVDGLLLLNGRAFVPDGSPLWPAILKDAQEGTHEGVQKTMHRMRASFNNPYALRLVL